MLAFVSFLQAIDQAFVKASLTTAASLRRSRLVRQVASQVCEDMPFVIRTGIRYSIGKDGFARFVLHLRDVKLREGAASLAALDRTTQQEIYAEAPDFVRELMSGPSEETEPSPAPINSASAVETAKPIAGLDWHVLRDGEVSGPFAGREFLELAEAGRLLPTDMIWRDGLKTWVALAQLPAFVAADPMPGGYLAAPHADAAASPAPQ